MRKSIGDNASNGQFSELHRNNDRLSLAVYGISALEQWNLNVSRSAQGGFQTEMDTVSRVEAVQTSF